jgi:hypothetical protein
MARVIGEEIGAGDDQAQADLLNGYCEMLSHTMPGQPAKVDLQMAFFTAKLSARSKRVICQMATFCEEET